MTADPLDIYEQVLPEHEWRALSAWLSTFYPFQLRWMLEDAKRAASVKARQIGWSHTTAGNGTLWGAFHGELTTIVSKGEQESIEVLEKARRHAQVLEGLGSRFAAVTKSSASEIQFVSGGRVLALPSSGGRGYTGNLILDEFAYHQHQKATWDAAVPAMRLGDFRLRVISTPNGVGDEYSNLIAAIRSGKLRGYALHEVTIEDAMADGFPVDLNECWADAKGDPRLFDQLYHCKFLDGDLQYIPTSAIDACSVESTYCQVGECYAGLDIGKTSDRTDLRIVKRDAGGIRWHQHGETRKRTSWEDIETLARVAFGAPWHCRRLCVDASGLGAFPSEELQRKFGRSRVEPVTFTQQTKEDLATGMYSAFVESTVRIPKTDVSLRNDICSIRRIITTAGNIRYDAPHTDEGHADSAWALALALHGCNKPPNVRQVVSGL